MIYRALRPVGLKRQERGNAGTRIQERAPSSAKWVLKMPCVQHKMGAQNTMCLTQNGCSKRHVFKTPCVQHKIGAQNAMCSKHYLLKNHPFHLLSCC